MRRDPGRRTSGPASTAHRHAGEHEPVEAQLFDKAFDVLALRRDRIIGVGRPVAVAVAALVEREAMKFVAQCQAAQIPGMRGQGPAMQEKERLQLVVAPIQVTEPKMTDHHGLLGGQYNFVEVEAGSHRSGLEMIVIFFGG
jgi:hypothetical protein